MKYDVIIIGAGLGGLTAGATLAKKGKKVLLLEQHIVPGGAATSFKRQGITFEVGLHEMDFGTPDRDMKHIIFKNLGLDKTLPMLQFPESWAVKTESDTYTIPHGRNNVIEYLGNLFPDEKKGLKKYFSAMKFATTINRSLACDIPWHRFIFFPLTVLPSVLITYIKQETVGKKLDQYFKSDRLKNILNANVFYYSDDPYQLSFGLNAGGQYSYYHSAVYIQGSSQVLSNQLSDIIQSHGGEVQLMADVQTIELDKNKAIGVTYQDKKSKENITAQGNIILANCAPQNIFNGKMVPTSFSEPKIENLEIECSLWTIYFITKEPMHKKYPGIAYSTFLSKDAWLNADQKTYTQESSYGKEHGCVVVDYTIIDSKLVPEDDPRGFGVLCGLSHYHDWINLSKEEYKAKKEDFIVKMLDYVETFFPGFKELVEYTELATPKTNERYLKTPQGTAYGFKQCGFLKHRGPRKSSQIKNLHFAGAWVFPGGGFTSAIISGYYAAMNILCPMEIRIMWKISIISIACTTIILFIKMIFN